MNILLIDDDKDDQTLFCEAVKIIAPHAQCELADNGNEGLQLLNRCHTLPTMVFLDINMPIMDGRQTIRSIRQTSRLASLPIVMYSTSSNRDEIAEFRAMGAQYLVKANRFDDLVNNLRSFIHAPVAHRHSAVLLNTTINY